MVKGAIEKGGSSGKLPDYPHPIKSETELVKMNAAFRGWAISKRVKTVEDQVSVYRSALERWATHHDDYREQCERGNTPLTLEGVQAHVRQQLIPDVDAAVSACLGLLGSSRTHNWRTQRPSLRTMCVSWRRRESIRVCALYVKITQRLMNVF